MFYNRWLGTWLAMSALIRISVSLPSSEEYKVAYELLPGLSEVPDPSNIPQMHAGHIPLRSEDADEQDSSDLEYFFWKFTNNDSNGNVDRPLIIWLNGGPGCSSMDGALVESGPFRVNSDGKLYLNEGSWISKGDLLFIDQPTGTGFSVEQNKDEGKIDKNKFDEDLEDVTKHFMDFLENYFKIFPEDLTRKIILSGESYAGQYIPFFANAILNHNKFSKIDGDTYDLKALLIGNGWIDPNTQSLSYLPFAMEKKLIDESNPNFKHLTNAHENCQNLINSASTDEAAHFSYQECENILNLLLSYTRESSQKGTADCLNMYNFNLKDSYPSCGMNWPKDISFVSKFFSTPGVIDSLHLDSDKIDHWKECTNSVGTKLSNPISKPSIHLLPGLLESGIEIVLFNGDKDLICNNKGVLDTIDNLKWGGIKGFSDDAVSFDWIHKSKSTDDSEEFSGYVKYDRNLTFVSVYNASHMVPFDKSLVSRGIVDIYSNDVMIIDNNGKNVMITTDDDSDQDATTESGDKPKENLEEEEQEAQNEEGKEKEGNKDKDGDDDNDNDDDDEDDHNSEGDDNDDDDDDDDDEDDNNEKQSNQGLEDSRHKSSEYEQEEEEVEEFAEEISMYKHKAVVVTIVTFLIVVLGVYAYDRRVRRKARHTILVDPNNRQHDSPNKTVSWADDLESGLGAEDDLEQDEQLEGGAPISSTSNKAGSKLKTKKKKKYTSLPNTEIDESFEMTDF
ncbi:Kex1p [Saccharomyces cerevisiae YJM689]|nr:Kex1p [Saccharomyces cerevisiae YJM689]